MNGVTNVKQDAEATREKILEAAMSEFSSYGVAGARVDRIAKTAGCNKNLIYIYFENKETLFATVLKKHLARVYEEVAFASGDLPGYAARVFDFAMANPDLMRLMAWYGLEQKVDGPTARTEALGVKIAAMLKAQKAGHLGDAFPPSFLIVAVMSLATAWTAANPFGPPLDPNGHKRPAILRKYITEAVKILSQAKDGDS